MGDTTYKQKHDTDEKLLATWLEEQGYPNPYWTTTQVQEEFEITGFMAPVCFATRRADGVKGTLCWADAEACMGYPVMARLYFGFRPNE